MQIQLPERVKQIIDTITAAGYEAYAVGGCIRDSLLKRQPEDWDITTSADPMQVKRLFQRTVDTGIQHGTVTVLLGNEGFEVTTYRIDGDYEDNRHPKEVSFTDRLTEDLRRRDFTINAMAYNEQTGLVDVFDGMGDLERRMIRCVGNPRERFTEDVLRMMRAVRFSAQLGYEIEEQTGNAIRELAQNLTFISAERIQVELVKLVTSPHPEYLRKAWEMGITAVILPEFDCCMETEQNNPHHCCHVGEHTLRSMKAIRADKVLRLAMLFHDIGKPKTVSVDEKGIHHFHGHPAVSEKMTLEIMQRLRFDNDTTRMVSALVRYHDYQVEPIPGNVRRAIAKLGEDVFPLLLEVKQADLEAQSEHQRREKEMHLQRVREIYEEVLAKKQCVSLKTLAVSGRDLIREADMQPGPELGQVLQKLLEQVIEDPSLNRREYLLQEAKNIGKK